MDSENNLVLVVVVALLLLVFVLVNRKRNGNWTQWRPVSRRGRMAEHLTNVSQNSKPVSFNPRLFNPDISEQVVDDNFIPLPTKADAPWSVNKGNFGESEILDDGASGNLAMGFNMCSKNCCSGGVWPAPHSMPPDDFLLMSGKEFLPSNLTCSNGFQDSGCLCMTPQQSKFLLGRGSNSSHHDDL
jgi:hypothetical protein